MTQKGTQQPKASARAIAFYLPQFHPTVENDEWWGAGFTEWTNVAKARPLYRSHQQPRLPGALGFYDLRLAETRSAQAALAQAHGVEAFCYWHYWFGGRRILDRVFDEVLSSKEPDFPFMLGWANQSWTGIWHGASDRMLIEQTYPGEDDYRAHFEYLTEVFADPRYVRVNGRPVMYIYEPGDLPEHARVLDLWRKWSADQGLVEPYFIGEVKGDSDPSPQLQKAWGVDALALVRLPYVLPRSLNPARLAWRKLNGRSLIRGRGPTVYDYRKLSKKLLSPLSAQDGYVPCVVPNWDNTPRSKRSGKVFENSSPDRFQRQVERAVSLIHGKQPEERLVFVKSWNEWAEGNYLEPDQEFGEGWLEAFSRAIFQG